MMQLLGERATAQLLVMDPDPRWRWLWDAAPGTPPASSATSWRPAPSQPHTPFLDAWRDFVAKRRPHERISLNPTRRTFAGTVASRPRSVSGSPVRELHSRRDFPRRRLHRDENRWDIEDGGLSRGLPRAVRNVSAAVRRSSQLSCPGKPTCSCSRAFKTFIQAGITPRRHHQRLALRRRRRRT